MVLFVFVNGAFIFVNGAFRFCKWCLYFFLMVLFVFANGALFVQRSGDNIRRPDRERLIKGQISKWPIVRKVFVTLCWGKLKVFLVSWKALRKCLMFKKHFTFCD